ncbi:ER membrane protein complex subunit 1-like [Babylonia areolata]|uniref:ER membrane protein complex subunit 1-like n=1 Tax=Babylonia areolata TaxID=304850 RepID=UPI003FD54CA1
MASNMNVQTAIFVSIILLASGLYEDQAGTYDWKQDYVGKVKNILWESVSHSGGGKKVFVGTERNIIASINTHDGSIAWRQVSEEDSRGKIDALLYNGNYIITVQAGGKFVRSWHAPTGNLHWETFLTSNDTMSASAMFLNGDKESVVVATSESLVSLKTSDGKTEWEVPLTDSDTVQRWYTTLRANGDVVAVGVSPGLRVTVVTVGPDGKAKKTPPRKLPAQWVQKDTSCQAVGGVAFVCYTADTSALQFLELAEGKVFKPFPFSELGPLTPTEDTCLEAITTEPGSPSPLVLLRVSRTHMALLSVSEDGVVVLKDLPKVEAADVAYEGDSKVLLTVQRADPETVEFTGVDLNTMKKQTDVSQRISLLENHGSVEKIFPMLFKKKKDGHLGAKVLMVTQDYALHCAHKAGQLSWKMKQGVCREMKQGVCNVREDETSSTLCPQTTGNGMLFTFNPVTGAMLNDVPTNGLDLGYKVIQAQLLNDAPDENFLKGLLLVDSNVKVHFFPTSMKSVVQAQNSKMFIHVTDTEAGLMKGYWLLSRGDEVTAENVWNIDLQGGQQLVTGVYTKRPIEHVHSQGRVLGDRSVLYKYLNPNMVVVVAEGEEASSTTSAKGPSGFFNVYLVDAVTGHIVFHENHKRTRGPVNVVHAENWVVYSFYSEKHRRYEMAVLELYEGKEQSNSTAFSSLSPPPNPLVLRQSYIFPVPIHCLASSVTEKGITNKNLIMALKVGGVLSLPKALLDPRRPSIPSQETMEEGTIPYIPELPVSTENFINYNRSIFNVRGIHTAPAGLESTSLVLVYGTDIFYTRVMPSKMFDVLKEDFDYIFIAAVLAIMILVSIISQKLAARKALKRAWK